MLKIPKGQISWIVGNMHVATRDCQVVREFYRRFKLAAVKQEMTPEAVPLFNRKFRKACYRHALKCHRANRQLCIDFRL